VKYLRIIIGIIAILVAVIGAILTQDNTAKSMPSPSHEQSSHAGIA
jgi:hypothetical protein